ncbi:hypothetical protein L596_015530 [Steinernema carpocapsae]|uniref:Uncharacterized protein n=1 Tax=Steinernema carpocapsae TaxID=34508 RepID=A0A4U5NF86_STECR|nr:hypothetical protein L596_015530 [Steinernema carpocapsae]
MSAKEAQEEVAAEEPQRRNADKRARTFDLNIMVQESLARFSDSKPDPTEASGSQDKEPETKKDSEAESSDDEIGPAMPPGFVVDKNIFADPTEAAEEDEFEDVDTISTAALIPTACEVVMTHGSKKPVTAIALDQAGSKFATGGVDYRISMFEFQKMDSAMKSFRDLTPCESHPIHSLAYSSNGEDLLVASGDAIIKVLDRQGKQKYETVRGDQYLVDLSQTKGHTSGVNRVIWHPFRKTEFMSAGTDGSLRLWNTEEYKEITKCINKQSKLIKVRVGGHRANPTTCCYSWDGKLIAAGCHDGSIHVWKDGNVFVNTAFQNRRAHTGPVTSLQFSPDGKRLLSRSMDGTLKIFALEKFKEPQFVVQNLPNEFAQTDCGFSPRGEVVFTATSDCNRKGDHGTLVFFDAVTFDKVYQIDYPDAACIRVEWHPRMNQILTTFSDGSVKIYYDPESSFRGALQCVNRPVKRARQSELIREEFVFSPLALDMFQPRGEEGEEKEVTPWRIRRYLRQKDNKTKPEFRKPADGPNSKAGVGPKLAAAGGTLHSFIAKEIGTSRNKDFLADTDIRASILRHADEAEADPQYITKAYRKTQPVPIFQKSVVDYEDSDEDELTPVYKKPKTTQ